VAGEVSAWKLGGLTPGELVARVWREIQKDEISDRVAALSYDFLFSLFPALLFLTAALLRFKRGARDNDARDRLAACSDRVDDQLSRGRKGAILQP
jgi:uncharacterized BrkB/YihY/UPF0761 family membrane protein